MIAHGEHDMTVFLTSLISGALATICRRIFIDDVACDANFLLPKMSEERLIGGTVLPSSRARTQHMRARRGRVHCVMSPSTRLFVNRRFVEISSCSGVGGLARPGPMFTEVPLRYFSYIR